MKKIILIILLGILLLGSIFAFMPPTHKYIDYTSLATYDGSSQLYESCALYPNQCYIGNVLTDISVVYYYVNKGAKYEVTHSPGFCVNMMDMADGSRGVPIAKEKACAIGSCLHAAEDWVAHTQLVPYAITHTGLVNEFIHMFAEQKMDNIVQKNHPEVRNQILFDLSEEDWNDCIPIIEDVLEKKYTNEGYEDTQETKDLINKFISEVKKSVNPESNTSYDLAFEKKVGFFQEVGLLPVGFLILYIGSALFFSTLAVLLIFKKSKTPLNYISIVIFGLIGGFLIYLFIALLQGNAFVTLIGIIKPISNLVPIGGDEGYIEQSIENVYSFFNEGEGFIASVDPSKRIVASGFVELREANNKVRILDYFFGIVLLSLTTLLIYKNFKRASGGNSIKL